MNPAERRLWEIVEAAARDVTNGDGAFYAKDLREQILTRLSADDLPLNVQGITLEMLAGSLASRFVSRRNPKPRGDAQLFDDTAVLPLGDGKRVWMGRADAHDLVAWIALSSRNLANVAKAESVRQLYGSERLDVMREHPGVLLGEIERNYFGHAPTDAPDDGAEDEDHDW